MVKAVKSMLEDVIRVGLLALVGFGLTIAVVWYLHFIYQEISGAGQVVIDDFTVVREDGKSDDAVGKALAQMLQARLHSLTRELRDAQANLTTSGAREMQGSAPVGNVLLWTQPIALETGLLKTVDMKLSVAGVDVGGLIPWAQRGLTRRRTINFALQLQAEEAEIFGTISALRLSNDGLRLAIKGVAGKSPPLNTIIDRLAHEILHRYLAQDTANKLELLDASEFYNLAGVLVAAAQANSKTKLGRVDPTEFAALLPRITEIADRAPNWAELGYLAAQVADSSKNPEKALVYYQRVLPIFTRANKSDLVTAVNSRIASLTKDTSASGPIVSTDPLPQALDYAGDVKPVRDIGAEGSGVGLALAMALEFQIAKATHENLKISGRHIYNAAREAGGLDLKIDTGAYVKDGIAVLATKGAVEESAWPYRPGDYDKAPPPSVENAKRYRIAAARELKNLNDVKRALKDNGPIVGGISVFQEMNNVSKTGIVPMPKRPTVPQGSTAILIAGYDDNKKQVKFTPCWGVGWGEQGFGYVSYEYIEKYLTDAWTFKLAQQ